MKIESHILKGPPEDITQRRFINISRAINGGMEFGSPKDGPVNINGSWVDITTPATANDEFTVTHNLGRVPTLLLSTPDLATIIYASRRNQWTATQAFFKCTGSSVPLKGFIV